MDDDDHGYCAHCYASLRHVLSSCEIYCPKCDTAIVTGDDWIPEEQMQAIRAQAERDLHEWTALNVPRQRPA